MSVGFQQRIFSRLFEKHMDKLTKLLKKLSEKQREYLEEVLYALVSGKTSALDIKKLKGVEEVYRVRLGDIRIIFQKNGGDIRVLEISRRDDSTYRNY